MPDFVSPLRLASLVSSAMPWGLLAAAAGALVVAAFVDARRQRHLPHIQYPTAGDEVALNCHKRTIARCPTLLEPYQPVPFLTNPHVETIFAAKFRKSPTNVHYTRQCLLMPDGGCVALDWEHKPEPDKELPANAPVLILLPGLTGGSEDSYVMWAVARAASRGMRAVVFNSRGTADSPVTTPQYYSASFTGDMRRVVDHVHKKYPAAPLLAAGWSLGANIMIRYLGEEGHATPIKAAVSMCNPFNLTISNEHLTRGFNKIYDKNLASGLKKIHIKHRRVWQGKLPPQYDAEALELAANCSTIREFDEGITRRTFGWPSVATYYAQSSSSLSIPQVTVPLLCIQALDDPIAPKEAIPFEALAANPHTVLVTTGTGGHLGWCGGDEGATGHPWTDRPMIEWLESVLQELHSGRDGDMTASQDDWEGEASRGTVGAPAGGLAKASKARQGVSVHATSGRGTEV